MRPTNNNNPGQAEGNLPQPDQNHAGAVDASNIETEGTSLSNEEFLKSLNYFLNDSFFTTLRPLYSSTLSIAKYISEPIPSKTWSDVILWPFRLVAKSLAIIANAAVAIVSGIATAIAHPVHTSRMINNLDKFKDPEVLASLLTNEKTFKMIERNLDTIKSIAVNNAPQGQRELISALLTKENIASLKNLLSGDKHKVFLKDLFSMAFSKDANAFSMGNIAKLLNTDGAKRFLSNISSPEHFNFISTLLRNEPARTELAKFGVNEEFISRLLQGPVKKHPEILGKILNGINEGKFFNKIFEVLRDHEDVKLFLKDNAKDFNGIIEKVLINVEAFRPIRAQLAQMLPNLDFAKLLTLFGSMKKDELNAIVKLLDEASKLPTSKQELDWQDYIAGAAHKMYGKLYMPAQYAAAGNVPVVNQQLAWLMTGLNLVRFIAPLAKQDRLKLVKDLGGTALGSLVGGLVDKFTPTRQARIDNAGLLDALGLTGQDRDGNNLNLVTDLAKSSALDILGFPLYFALGYDAVEMFKGVAGVETNFQGIVDKHNRETSAKYNEFLNQALSQENIGNMLNGTGGTDNRFNLAEVLTQFVNAHPEAINNKSLQRLATQDISHTILNNKVLHTIDADNFTITSSKIDSSTLVEFRLTNSIVSNTAITNTSWHLSEIDNVQFTNIDFTGTNFGKTRISNSQFNGKIKIDEHALAGATIDVSSLKSLISACERSGSKLDLSDVTIEGNLEEIDQLDVTSSVLINFTNANVPSLDIHTTTEINQKSFLRDFQIARKFGVIEGTENLKAIHNLFAPVEGDVISAFCASNIDSPIVSQLMRQSIIDDRLNEELFRRNLISHVISSHFSPAVTAFTAYTPSNASMILSSICGEMGVKTAEFMSILTLNDAKQLVLSDKYKKFAEAIWKLFEGSIEEYHSGCELDVALKAMIKSYFKDNNIGLSNLTVSNDEYLKIKEAYRKAGLELDTEFTSRHELQLLGINKSSLIMKFNNKGWPDNEIYERLNKLGTSRDISGEIHFSNIKNSDTMLLQHLIKSRDEDGVYNLEEFKLRVVSAKLADALSEKLFGRADNRAKDCLIIQELVYNAVKNVKISSPGEDKLTFISRLFDSQGEIKAHVLPLVDHLYHVMRQDYCQKTVAGVATGGIQLNTKKINDLENKLVLITDLSNRIQSFGSLVEARSISEGDVSIPPEQIIKASRDAAKMVAEKLWGAAGIEEEANRYADFKRLESFLSSTYLDVVHNRFESDIVAANKYFKQHQGRIVEDIEKLIKQNALSRTAMGMLTGGTQLKSNFEKILKPHIQEVIHTPTPRNERSR